MAIAPWLCNLGLPKWPSPVGKEGSIAMDTPTWLRSALLALGLGMVAAPACGPAHASPIQVRDGNGGSVFNGGPGSVNLTIKVNGSSQSVAAGAFALEYRHGTTGPWTGFLTYCLEPDEWLGISGTTPQNGTLVGSLAATVEYAATAAAIGALYATWFTDSLTSALKSAAFQVALWELAFDTGANLAAGAFQLVGSAGVRAQAEAYLAQANWIAGGPPGVILREGNQDLLIEVAEPAAIALFLAALLGLALAARRQVGAPRAG